MEEEQQKERPWPRAVTLAQGVSVAGKVATIKLGEIG